MTNSSSVHFVQKTLTGNTPVVWTMIIPSVVSVAKDTGSGLLPPSVTARFLVARKKFKIDTPTIRKTNIRQSVWHSNKV
jgi:hypothetical protein